MVSRFLAVVLCCLMISGLFVVNSEAQAEDARVMVLPFDDTSAGDFKYLTDSIRSMLSSRLAARPGVKVVDYNLTAADLRAIHGGSSGKAGSVSVFDRLKTDYFLTGALYTLQTGLKIQVTINGRETSQVQEGVFTALAINEEHIISSVEDLADDVVARGLMRSDDGSFLAEVEADEKEGIAGFNTEHPEKVFKKGLYGGAIVAESNMKIESVGVRRSSDLPLTIVSTATGDLDNDGILEIVAASRTGVEVYRFEETLFRKLGEYSFGKQFKIHAVNIADLNGDGQEEIYISANDNIVASSAIFSWSVAEGLKPVVTGIDYYIRPIELPNGELILAAQKGSLDSTTGFIEKNVVSLLISGDTKDITEGEPLPLPENVRLFDFVWANINGSGGKELIAVDRNEKLLVYDTSNSLLWVSEKDYGGSRNFIGPPKSAITDIGDLFGKNANEKFEQPIIYVPTRILAADLDNDGADEIIVGNNKRITPKWFVSFREYDGGSVVCLSWQGTEMQDVWRTNTIAGYLADYTFVPPEDGSLEAPGLGANTLYLAQVPDKQLFGLSFSADSKLLKYELTIVAQ